MKIDKIGKIGEKMNIKCVVFDFDDTLVLSEKHKRQFFFDIVNDVPFSEEIMTKILSNLTSEDDRFTIAMRFAEISMKGEDAKKIKAYGEKLADDYSEKVENMVAVCEEVNGATDLLDKLKEEGYSVSLCSATPEVGVRQGVEKRGWNHYFENVFGRPATKTENIKKVARLGNFSPDEVVMIGDGDNDRVGAEEFGCAFIGVKSDKKRFTAPVKHVVTDMTEVWELLPVI